MAANYYKKTNSYLNTDFIKKFIKNLLLPVLIRLHQQDFIKIHFILSKNQQFIKDLGKKQKTNMKAKQTLFSQKYDFMFKAFRQMKEFNNKLEQQLKLNIQKDQINYGLGCMYGAFIGDALGSYCQFKDHIQQNLLMKTMQMPGNGTFRVKPGQFTDDSQMASHLLSGLNTYKNDIQFWQQKDQIILNIARQYVGWVKSKPFDIGFTTRKAMAILRKNTYQIDCKQQEGQKINLGQEVTNILSQIKQTNKQSLSNGSLMRITPMAYFISLLVQDEQKSTCKDYQNFIKNQINLTHGNVQMHQIGYIWVQLLVELILRKKTNKSINQIYKNFLQKYQNDKKIKQWIELSQGQKYMSATVEQGCAKIAFSFGIMKMKQLLQKDEKDMSQQNYIQIIRDVIGRAGDTDTNAAIVGGLIGAIIGFKKLPIKYLKKQFQLRLNQQEKQCSYRGQFYQPRRQAIKAIQLMQKFGISNPINEKDKQNK